MKANYPVEYMAALLSIEAGSHSATKEEKVFQAIEECQRMKIKVLPPDINLSHQDFSVESAPDSLEGKAIRFGFTAIKNVGEAAIEAITEARGDLAFRGVSDFFSRVDNRRVNKKVAECLIRVGCFDTFASRAQVLAAYDSLRSHAQTLQTQADSGQSGLFDEDPVVKPILVDNFPKIPDLTSKERLDDEKRLLGVYLNGHPQNDSLKKIQDMVDYPIALLDPQKHQHAVTVGGLINRIKVVNTKNTNAEMAFISLEDLTGKIEAVIFPKLYDSIKADLKTDMPYLVTGKISEKDDRLSLVVSKLRPLELDDSPAVHQLLISRGTSQEKLKQLGVLLKSSPGNDQVEIHIPNNGDTKIIRLPYLVDYREPLLTQIKALLTPDLNT